MSSATMFERLEARRMFAASAIPKFTETDLVSDGAVSAAHTDSHIKKTITAARAAMKDVARKT